MGRATRLCAKHRASAKQRAGNAYTLRSASQEGTGGMRGGFLAVQKKSYLFIEPILNGKNVLSLNLSDPVSKEISRFMFKPTPPVGGHP